MVLSTISLLVPTRGRPKLLMGMLESVFAMAAEPDAVNVVVYIDDDDEETLSLDLSPFNVNRIVGPRQSMGTLNASCYAHSTGDIIMLCNDDVVVRTQGWDTRIRDAGSRFPDQVYLLYPNDLFKGKEVATFPILSRVTCDAVADPFPGEYRGAFIDVHIMDIFKRLKGRSHQRAVYLDDVVFEHMHYLAGKSPFDETYRQRDRFGDDRTFMALSGARGWAAKRLQAIIEGTEMAVADRLTVARPPEGWFIRLSWTVLRDGPAPLNWRINLFIRLWGRFIYRKAKALLRLR